MTATRPVGCSVFLVEDEVMIRMMVADMLEELGHSVAAGAGEIGEAARLAQSTECDVAILDVNVTGCRSRSSWKRWRRLSPAP